MAKHLAKCLYCGEQFDVNSEPFFKPRSNRYAHLSCYEKHQANMTQEQKDEELLYQYIKEIYGKDYNYMMIRKQIETYQKQGYTFNGIRLSLKFFYEVKNNSTKDSNGGIGIVPYVYEEAKKYYYQLYLAQQDNQKVTNYKAAIKQVVIKPPEVRRRPPHFFNLEGDN